MNRPLFIGILLLSSLGMGFFLTWPKFQEVQVVWAELESRQQELQNKEDYFAELQRTRDSFEEFSEEFAKLNAALPPDAQLPALYDFLQNSGAFSGLNLRSISVSAPQGAEGSADVKTIQISMEMAGSYGALQSMLSRLYAASRIVDIQSFTFSSSVAEGGQFTLSLQLNAFSY